MFLNHHEIKSRVKNSGAVICTLNVVLAKIILI